MLFSAECNLTTESIGLNENWLVTRSTAMPCRKSSQDTIDSGMGLTLTNVLVLCSGIKHMHVVCIHAEIEPGVELLSIDWMCVPLAAVR